MNSHHPFKPKRPRTHSEAEESSFTSPAQFTPTLVDLTFSSLPYDIRLQLDQLAQSYGIASGVQIHQNIQQEYSRKKRRLDQSFPMPSDGGSSSLEESLEKFPSALQHDHRHLSQPGPSTMQSPSIPLVKRLADLSFALCPCCGFNMRQWDGYQQIPEEPVAETGLDRPYESEKPPFMQAPPEAFGAAASLVMGQQASVTCEPPVLTSPPMNGFHVMPDQSALGTPLVADASTSQQATMPLTSFYPNQQPMKQEPEMSNSVMMPSNQFGAPEQPQLPYGPNMDLVSTATLVQPPMTATENMVQYNLVVAEQMDGAINQGGWNDMALLDPNFDLALPNNQRGGKRGPFKDPNLREQTAQTRKIGSCIRCRMQRIRCEHNPEEPGGPCMTCKKVSSNKTNRFPCLRYKITDVRLFKPGPVPGYEWTRRWNNNISDPIQGWASEDIKTIHISEGLSNKVVKVSVRRFVPQPGDKLERTWDFKGTKRSVTIPPYALVNLDDVKRAYSDHIRDSMSDAFKTLLGRPEGLLYKTYGRAWQMYRDRSTPMDYLEVLHRTLMLWMSIRLSTRSSFIVGEETLGMPQDILDETSPNHGRIPLPPVLGAQMDLILIHHVQTRLRRELLDKLQKMIQKNKQGTWLVTYLVTFILLHNTALITAHDASYAKKHGMKRRFAREDKVREYHLGANILLAHFHYCNKGIYPFSAECKDQDLRTLANLDEDKIQFVQATRAYAKQHESEWEGLRNGLAYDNDYYFVSQLFEENWVPRQTI